jgi:hypothetical protein
MTARVDAKEKAAKPQDFRVREDAVEGGRFTAAHAYSTLRLE